LTLSTGVPPSGLSAIELVSTRTFDHWTIFDDVVSRGERVSFSGGPAWVELFGDRGTNNFRETGHGPRYRDDDVQGVAHLEAELLSSDAPALSVLHISETDFAAHQYGTTGSAYAEVLRFWDDSIERFLQRVLVHGTTVIVTADHGNDLLGSHGGSDPIYRRVPVLMWGAGIAPGSRIEMQARDMPSTIAVLLGIRAPAGVFALPAVEAMDLSADERARLLNVAYGQAVLQNPRVAESPALLVRAQALVVPDAAAERAPGSPARLAPDNTPGIRAIVADLESQLAPIRNWNALDWAFVAVTFAIAVLFGVFAWARIGPRRAIGIRQIVIWTVAFALIEFLFVIRIVFSGPIKQA